MLPCAQGLSKDTARICLESINSSTRQHPVDADNLEEVEPQLDVKTVFTTAFRHVRMAQIWATSRASEESCSCASDAVGHRVGTHPVRPSYAPIRRCGSQHQGHLGRSGTLGTTCSYSTSNIGGAAAHGDTRSSATCGREKAHLSQWHPTPVLFAWKIP